MDREIDRRFAILEAPSSLGLRSSGVERLAARLLELGLAERIGARHAGRLEPAPYRPAIDPETRVLNAPAMARWTPKLADAVEAVIETGEVPIILGGDCSILLGSMLALRRRGRFGLLFIDGHADFFGPESDPTGEAASMDLAFVTGHGPRPLTDIEGKRPLVRPDDAVAFGFRDGEDQARFGSQPLPRELMSFDLATVRSLGAAVAAQAAVDHLTREGLDGFFVHIDADCLDDAVMPAGRLPDSGRALVVGTQDDPGRGTGERQSRRFGGHDLQPRSRCGRVGGTRPRGYPRGRTRVTIKRPGLAGRATLGRS